MAESHKAIGRKFAAKIAQQVKDNTSPFPSVVTQNT